MVKCLLGLLVSSAFVVASMSLSVRVISKANVQQHKRLAMIDIQVMVEKGPVNPNNALCWSATGPNVVRLE